ncbi:MAG: glycosyltransferase family 4 protein [Tepidamorphaceae bacterium]|nr:glycosyltransferase family 4 protein [Rhodobiaceae bacterium]MCC0047795.1 glycosyltransferase family 4 protein [Rhodobiaceae bacterium]
MPADLTTSIWTALACGAVTLLATPRLARALANSGVLDIPGPRSNHAAAVPRGGGMAIVVPVAVAWACVNLNYGAGAFVWSTWAGFVLLMAVSWCDDLRPQPVRLRLFVQTLAVVLPLATLPAELRLVPDYLPLIIERVCIGLAWMWFLNAMNFMDGLDGLATGQSVTAAGGAFAILAILSQAPFVLVSAPVAAAIAASSLAFLPFNWPPARVFLGDAGSVPIGYGIGWLLLLLLLAGQPAAALILPLYFLCDATGTLIARLVRGERITQAHSDHLYQRARRAGKSHTWVTTRALAANILLAGAAVFSLYSPLEALAAAAVIICALTLAFAASAMSSRKKT